MQDEHWGKGSKEEDKLANITGYLFVYVTLKLFPIASVTYLSELPSSVSWE